MNPEFVPEGTEIRPNLEYVWNNQIEKSKLQPHGFLNWAELNTMQKSGVIDIQSHSMSHNFYFYSDNIIDIYTGQPKYNWLPWLSQQKKRKPYYINEDQSKFVKHGIPVFEFDRALRVRRYMPNEALLAYASNEYSRAGGSINKKEFIKDLNEKLVETSGEFETDEDMRTRYTYELLESKRIIQQKLNKTVEFICWPGGGFNQFSVNIAKEVGYKAMTASANKVKSLDIDGLQIISRNALTSFIQTPKRDHYIKNPQFLVTLFKYHEGNRFSKYKYRIRKLILIILDKFS